MWGGVCVYFIIGVQIFGELVKCWAGLEHNKDLLVERNGIQVILY